MTTLVPVHYQRANPFLRGSALSLVALVASVLAGCGRTATRQAFVPTKTATPRLAHVGYPGDSRRLAITLPPEATELPWPTSTPWPTLLPAEAPHPVVMSVADAERAVLSWTLPANEARIERSMVVTVADLLASRPHGEYALGLAGSVSLVNDDGQLGQWFDKQEDLMPDKVLIVVESSQRPIPLDYVAPEATETPTPGPTPAEPGRERWVAYFAAASGVHLGDQPLDYYHEAEYRSWLDALARRPAAALVLVASASPTAADTATTTPPESPTPESKPTQRLPLGVTGDRLLQPGQVPAALVDAARELAEVPGSRWIYLVTQNQLGPHWSQHVVTETITSAWQLAPDVMMMGRSYEVSPRTAGDSVGWVPGDPWRTECFDSQRYYVLPRGRIGASASPDLQLDLADMRRLLDRHTAPAEASCELATQFRLPPRPNEILAAGSRAWWATQGKASVKVPAGRFDDCLAVYGYRDDRNGNLHWTCPGVGAVRIEALQASGMTYGFDLYELVDYDIPPITPVP